MLKGEPLQMIEGIIIFIAGVALGIASVCIWALCAAGDDEDEDFKD